MAPVDGGVWVDVGPLGDGVGLQVGAPQEGHGEDLLQREAVVGEPRPVADGPLLPASFLRTSPSNDMSHRLATCTCILSHSPVSIRLCLRCGLPPHVPTTTLARHPACQEPHVLTPLYGGISVKEDLSDEAVIGPWRQAHANRTIDGTCCCCCCHLCYMCARFESVWTLYSLCMVMNYSVEVHHK